MDPLIARPEFVDSISQVIRFWSAEFIPEFREPADSLGALKLHLLWQRIEPPEEGKRAVLVSVKVDFGAAQASMLLCSHFWEHRSMYQSWQEEANSPPSHAISRQHAWRRPRSDPLGPILARARLRPAITVRAATPSTTGRRRVVPGRTSCHKGFC